MQRQFRESRAEACSWEGRRATKSLCLCCLRHACLHKLDMPALPPKQAHWPSYYLLKQLGSWGINCKR